MGIAMRWGTVGILGMVRRVLPLVGAIPFLCLILAEPAVADKRVALVIGNSAYRSVTRLDNPTNDAKLMADTLRDLGFTLVGDAAQLDLDKTAFDSAVQSFSVQIQGADVGLFYYAGHGVQVRGANYLVPVSANPTREADVDFQLVDTALVLRQMESAGTKLNIVILDACRNNPFGDRGFRATTRGLAQMQAPEGTLISYATQPGNVAQDGAEGNSPYTKALAATIRKPGLGIFDAFNEVGLAVKRATGGSQQPWVSSSPIDGSFYFVAPTAGAPPALPAPSAAVIATPPAPPPLRRQYRVIDDVSEGILNMRAGASTQSPVVVAIPAGAPDLSVGRCRPADDGRGRPWCDVLWRGYAGWVSSCCIVEITARAKRTFRVLADVSQGILNVRDGPGVRHNLVVSIPAGSSDVTVGRCRMPDDGGRTAWCEVEWRNKAGWASACCMVDVRTGAPARMSE
jgi:uncharacterized protein YraI